MLTFLIMRPSIWKTNLLIELTMLVVLIMFLLAFVILLETDCYILVMKPLHRILHLFLSSPITTLLWTKFWKVFSIICILYYVMKVSEIFFQCLFALSTGSPLILVICLSLVDYAMLMLNLVHLSVMIIDALLALTFLMILTYHIVILIIISMVILIVVRQI